MRLVELAVALSLATAAANAEPVSFSGLARSGETFEQVIRPGFAFRLLPIEQGFRIWLGDPAEPAANHAAPAASPCSRADALDIEGWHFAAEASDTPQEERDFAFDGRVRGRGLLSIDVLEIAPRETGQRATIERMAFRVRLTLDGAEP